jgi:hypothetical protein
LIIEENIPKRRGYRERTIYVPAALPTPTDEQQHKT